MKRLVLAVAVSVAALFAASAAAGDGSSVGAVYSISNAASGNELVVYTRSAGGALTASAHVDAGGAGTGGGLASQGAVTLSDDGRYVLAVNPGSNSVAAFDTSGGGEPELLNTAPSGGIRPVSVDVHKSLVYVLNKNNAALATVSGFTLGKDGLTPIAGSTRFLNAGATDAGQVKFSPSGDTLVVTGRSSQRIDTFSVGADGRLSNLQTFGVAPGSTPFGFDFDNKGHLLVSLAGVGSSSGAASYELGADGAVSSITAPIASGQRAACWLVASNDGRFAFVANAASSSVSTFAVSPAGELEFQGAVTIDGMTALDLASSDNGRYLYVLAAGSHGIVAFEIGSDGTLTHVGTQADVPLAAAGIAAR